MGSIDNVKIVGLKKTNLTAKQLVDLKRILADHNGKLKRLIKTDYILEVKIEEHSKTGKKHNWSVLMKVKFPGVNITAEENAWEIEKATHKCFNNLKKRIQGYFRGNERGWKKDYE